MRLVYCMKKLKENMVHKPYLEFLLQILITATFSLDSAILAYQPLNPGCLWCISSSDVQ
jgi:hypothetical protein